MITDYLQEHHLLGLSLGLCTFLIIGIFHPIVIKGEYHFGVRCWWWFLIAGIILCVAAFALEDIFLSVISAVAGFSCFWSILEVFEQRKRVERGWFPENPKRKRANQANPSHK